MPFTESERITAQHWLGVVETALPRASEAISILRTESARLEEQANALTIFDAAKRSKLTARSNKLDKLADNLRRHTYCLEDLIEEATKELSK